VAKALLITFKNYTYDARTQRHAEALAERGDEVDVICLSGPPIAAPERVNLIRLRMPRYRGSRQLSYFRSYIRFLIATTFIALRRSMRRRYDVAVIATIPDALVLCALPIRLFGTRIVLDMRDTMPELYREKFGTAWHDAGARLLLVQERISAWLADQVIAVHEPHRMRLVQAGIPRQKISVVMNCPDPRVFAPRSNGHGAPERPFTLVYHGTLTRRLGLDVAVRALALVRDRCPQLRLVVRGVDDDGCLATLRSLVSTLNLDGRVVFAERVPVPDLPRALAEASAGLVPNLATSATELMLPVKLLEYAALGIPVIAPQLAAIQYYFDDNAVRFFRPEDPEDLSLAIRELYDSPQRRVELSRRAAEIADRISWLRGRNEYYRAIDTSLGRTTSG
jgi:glycosyltransferase involved in cell wall biosynthesis